MRIITVVRVIPVIIQSIAEAIIIGTIMQERMSTIINRKSTINHVVSATEGLNGVLSGKI
jgi:hypothetical protein